MLNYFFHSQLALGIAECVVAALLALVVMLLARQARSGIAQGTARSRDSWCCTDRRRGRDPGFHAARPAVDFSTGACGNDACCGKHRAQAGEADSTRLSAGIDFDLRRERAWCSPS